MKWGCLLCALGLSVPCGICPAYGQSPRPDRPYLGLFGAGVGEWEELATANLSLGGGYDKNILIDLNDGSGDQRVRKDGPMGQVSGGLNYSVNRSGLLAGISGVSSVRYYPGVSNPYLHAHRATAGASARIRNNSVIAVNQSIAYGPFEMARLFPTVIEMSPGESAPLDLDVVLSRTPYLTYEGDLALTQQVARHAFLSGSYEYQISDSDSVTPVGRYISQRMGTVFRLGLSRDLSWRLGYTYQQVDYGIGESRIGYHEADIGLDFSKALALSRNTTFSFSTGSSAIVRRDQTVLRAVGDARLNHEMGRTWNASLGYGREMQFVEALRQPVFSDSATFQLSGLVNRRVRFTSTAQALIGSTGFGGDNGFDTYHAAVGLSIAVSRNLGLGVDYVFYQHRFESNVGLPVGVPRDVDRQSVRAHLDLWAILKQRLRSTDATR